MGPASPAASVRTPLASRIKPSEGSLVLSPILEQVSLEVLNYQWLEDILGIGKAFIFKKIF